MNDQKRQAYRNTRTGAVRLSSSPLGFPYAKADDDAAPKASKSKASKSKADQAPAEDEG